MAKICNILKSCYIAIEPLYNFLSSKLLESAKTLKLFD